MVNTLSVDVNQHRTKANTYLVNTLSVDVKQHRTNGLHLLGQYTLCGRKTTQNEGLHLLGQYTLCGGKATQRTAHTYLVSLAPRLRTSDIHVVLSADSALHVINIDAGQHDLCSAFVDSTTLAPPRDTTCLLE